MCRLHSIRHGSTRWQAIQPEGWVQSMLGPPEAAGLVETTIVEMRAPNGNVRFAVIESRP